MAFPKPLAIYKLVKIYGDNVAVTEHDEVRIPVFMQNSLTHRRQWKRHRKAGAPAFSERNNSMVHRETTRIVLNLFDAWKSEGMIDVVTVSNMADVTFELALQVITVAGFGYNVAWKDEGRLPEGHTMVCPCCLWW
jgi:cytochrome P450